jgi:hypothetical protein
MGLGLAACSSGTPTASRTTPKVTAGTSETTTTATPATTAPALKGGANPNGPFCKNLAVDNAAAVTLSKALDAATKSKDLAVVKPAFESFLSATRTELAKVTGSATSAPANVQAAFATVTRFYANLEVIVAHATSVAQIQSSIASLTRTPAITGARTTISAYVTQQCGTATTPST